jgi:hypothetical protein
VRRLFVEFDLERHVLTTLVSRDSITGSYRFVRIAFDYFGSCLKFRILGWRGNYSGLSP